jgi:pyruvate/2-oxoglutarate/acetoin dehydrogenase E1 component
MTEISLVQAVNLALKRAMTDEPRVIVLGEDVGIDGGVFRATDGLIQQFGAERVMDTPLASSPALIMPASTSFSIMHRGCVRARGAG